MEHYLLVTILFVIFYNIEAESNLVRKTRYGLIRGTLTRSEVDPTIEYYSFKGVPYARAPVGNLRFQEPLPPQKWYGIREAKNSANICVQISDNFLSTNVVGSEDFLYLEIFEPKTARAPDKSLIPVLVWFHDGTFIFRTAINKAPDFFMEKPIVIVTVGYRLNVFGFLSTKDKHAKGNNDLKDQALTLQWVKENIENFGGDSNNVTIFGESSGGASVQYHMLSPRSQGLFHKSISQSGSTLNRAALQEQPLETTHKLTKGLGIHKTKSKQLIKELQKIDYEIIMKLSCNESVVGFYTPYYAQPFAPIIESESDTAFISESTFSILMKGEIHNKVPYITGFNTEEGSFAYYYINISRIDINIYETTPELLIPISMNIKSKESSCYDEYMSQELFVRGITKSIDLMYNFVPLYLFSYTGSNPLSYLGGVEHHEEDQYIWKNLLNMSESDMLTSKRMITLWTNFAATGNPTPEKDELLRNVIWPRVNSSKPFLNIGSDLTILENPEQADYEFWKKLFEVYGNPPYNTY